MKYSIPESGEWIQPIRKGYKLCCCDCGLVHILDFKLIGKLRKRIRFRVFRDNRATGQVRRGLKNENIPL